MNESVDHLLIDARNILYRIIYGYMKNDTKYHTTTLLLKFLTSIIREFKPKHVHVFWDDKRDNIWRRKIFAGYKDRDTKYVRDISENLAISTSATMDIMKYMNVRQYHKDHMEADDLIYAAVSILHPQTSIIVSTDSDLSQIPYVFQSSRVYHPKKQSIIDIPSVNPVFMKSLVGDKSDSIPGYKGVGEVTAQKILAGNRLNSFLSENDKSLFYRNLTLIDLSLCPNLLGNKKHALDTIWAEPIFDDAEIRNSIMRNKINGMISEYSSIMQEFRFLRQ